MKFNPSQQSYGSGHFYTDEHSNIKMTHDPMVASGGSGGFGIEASPPPALVKLEEGDLRRLKWGLLIGGIVLVIAWDPLKAIWRSK